MEKILVVDDELEVCKALEEFLVLKGYSVDTAQNGPDALEKVRNDPPQIILLDIIMPGMSGMEVLEAIRKINDTIGVIMITAVTDEQKGNYALTQGAFDYITKPVDLEYLETVLMVKLIDFFN